MSFGFSFKVQGVREERVREGRTTRVPLVELRERDRVSRLDGIATITRLDGIILQTTSHFTSRGRTHGDGAARCRRSLRWSCGCRRCRRYGGVHADADGSDIVSSHAGVEVAVAVGGEPGVPGREFGEGDGIVGLDVLTQVCYIDN